MGPEYTSILALAMAGPAAGEAKDVTPWAALAAVLALLGAHAVWSLSGQIRTELRQERGHSWARSVGGALRLAVIWAVAAGGAVLVSFPASESEASGAAGALLLILGGFVFGSYAFALALVTLAGFFRLRADAAGAPWPRQALITGCVVSVTWLVMCPSPILLTGEVEPSAPHLAGLLLGVVSFSLAVVAGVFWRTRQPLPVGEAGPAVATPDTPKGGLQAVALTSLLWPAIIPAGMLGLYHRLRTGEMDVSNPAFDGWGVALWLIPVVMIVGLHLRREWGRKLALAVFGIAILVYVLFMGWSLVDGNAVGLVVVAVMVLLFGWPLWYLSRSEIRKGFGP